MQKVSTILAGLVVMATLGLPACSDDEEPMDDGSGGTGATGATGGSSGSGASGGSGATGGSSGAGGVAGGAGGMAGAGGAVGGAGGAVGGAGGAVGGAGGAVGGAGGTAPVASKVNCNAATIAQTVDVTLAGDFTPNAVTISVGEVVEWANTETAVAHTATSGTGGVIPSPDGAFDTGSIAAGSSVCLEFSEAGSYDYYCGVHPATMSGTITVQ